MDRQQAVDRDCRGVGEALDRPCHRPDVPEHFLRGDVDTCLARCERGLGSEESPASHDEALDVRRRDGLRAQEKPGECFGVDQRLGRGIQLNDRSLRVRDVGGDVTVEAERPAPNRVRNVRFVLAALAIRAG
jgi:hypothetical protein